MTTAFIILYAVGCILLFVASAWTASLIGREKDYKEANNRLNEALVKLDLRSDALAAKEKAFERDRKELLDMAEAFAKEQDERCKDFEKRLEESEKKLAAKKRQLAEAEAEFEKMQGALADRLMDVEKREAELDKRKGDVTARESVMHFLGVKALNDMPNIIEPADEPKKVAFGTTEKKRCPKCGKDMEMKTDVCYTSNPPQYKYICPECGYGEIDTCPPTHNLVGTEKKPVKKAKKGGKK